MTINLREGNHKSQVKEIKSNSKVLAYSISLILLYTIKRFGMCTAGTRSNYRKQLGGKKTCLKQLLIHLHEFSQEWHENLFNKISLLNCVSHLLFSHLGTWHICLCPALRDAMDCSTPGSSVLHHHLDFAQIHVHWVNNVIWPSFPLLTPSPPAIDLSSMQVLSSKLALCIRWPKYWSFNFSINPSNKYSELISFRIGWFDHHEIQGISRVFFYHHNSKALILQPSAIKK